MDIKLVFTDWERGTKSIYDTEEGMELSIGDFHSGTTFKATIDLDAEHERQLEKALKTGACPVFYVVSRGE